MDIHHQPRRTGRREDRLDLRRNALRLPGAQDDLEAPGAAGHARVLDDGLDHVGAQLDEALEQRPGGIGRDDADPDGTGRRRLSPRATRDATRNQRGEIATGTDPIEIGLQERHAERVLERLRDVKQRQRIEPQVRRRLQRIGIASDTRRNHAPHARLDSHV